MLKKRLAGEVRRGLGFSLIEMIVAMATIGIALAAFFSGLTFGLSQIRLSRENLRATQILLEKAECLRLFTWDQITNSTYLPTNFLAHYETALGTNVAPTGLIYRGTISILTPPKDQLKAEYNKDLRLIVVRLDWQTPNGPARSKSMTTYYSRYGMQNYIFN